MTAYSDKIELDANPELRRLWEYQEQKLDEQLSNEMYISKQKEKLLNEQSDSCNENNESCLNQTSSKHDTNFQATFIISPEGAKMEIKPEFDAVCVNSDSDGEEVDSNEQETEILVPEQHPNTIRKYVAMLLAFFSNLRVEYHDGKCLATRKLPVFYGSKEKLLHIEEHDFQELMNGNTNFLPRASLIIDSMQYDQNRQQNKNVQISRDFTQRTLSGKQGYTLVQSSPSPYNISVRLNIITRGMNDAMMLVEQVAAFFNPFYTFDFVENGVESSVRLQLDSVMFEPQEIDSFSTNEVMLDFGFTLYGNMFKPKYQEFVVDKIKVNFGTM